jgi:hypothetical protein
MRTLIVITGLLLGTACASINSAQLDGKVVVTSTRAAPVILTVLGAPLSECLADLSDEGVTQVNAAAGMNKNFWISRLSNVEICQATGTK